MERENAEPIKPTNFDPRSLRHNTNDFLDCLREGLNEIQSSAVILQVLPKPKPVDISEEELSHIITNAETVVREEEVVAENISTIMEMRSLFLAQKGVQSDLTKDEITDEMCKEYEKFIKITHNQALMIFDKTIN